MEMKLDIRIAILLLGLVGHTRSIRLRLRLNRSG